MRLFSSLLCPAVVIVLVISSSFASCSSSGSEKNEQKSIPSNPSAVSNIENLKNEKNAIDTLFKNGASKMLILAKVKGKKELVRITGKGLPDSVISTFNILKDSDGRVIRASESPYSKNDEWGVYLIHYFDQNGRTFSFIRHSVFFNGFCTNGMAYETETEYYTTDFVVFDREYKVVDEKNNPLSKEKCKFPHEYEFQIYNTAEKYLINNHIPSDN